MPQMGDQRSPRARSSSGASSPATGSRPTRRSPTSPPTRWTSRSRRRPAGALARIVVEAGETVDVGDRDRRDRRRRREPGRGASASGAPRAVVAAGRPTDDARPFRVISPVVRRIADEHDDRSARGRRAPASAAASARRTYSPTSRRGGNGRPSEPDPAAYRVAVPARARRPTTNGHRLRRGAGEPMTPMRRRSPSTWCAAAGRRRTARPSSRST